MGDSNLSLHLKYDGPPRHRHLQRLHRPGSRARFVVAVAYTGISSPNTPSRSSVGLAGGTPPIRLAHSPHLIARPVHPIPDFPSVLDPTPRGSKRTLLPGGRVFARRGCSSRSVSPDLTMLTRLFLLKQEALLRGFRARLVNECPFCPPIGGSSPTARFLVLVGTWKKAGGARGKTRKTGAWSTAQGAAKAPERRSSIRGCLCKRGCSFLPWLCLSVR